MRLIGWLFLVSGVACGILLREKYGWGALLLAAAFDVLWDIGKSIIKASRENNMPEVRK